LFIAASLGFNGKAIIANLVVTPDATAALSPAAGFDPQIWHQWKPPDSMAEMPVECARGAKSPQ
jgi:hypothetical protein